MLDLIDRTTETTPHTFNEQEALDYLTRHPAERSARKLAPIWNWHRSRVQRLLSRIDSETRETSETSETIESASQPESAAATADESGWVWSIPHQYAINCTALADGGVEIKQEGQYGPNEDQAIHVAAGNVVKLARSILHAAGFDGILIATLQKGGYADLEDGHLASNYREERR